MSNFGKYRAIVVDTKDDEKRGRIKVKCPAIYGEDLSPYCEPCVPYAYDKGGDFVLPKKNDFIWIEFENGDIEKPIYRGGLWAKEKSPIADYDADATKTRQIEFEGNKITMKKGFTEIINTDSKVKITLENGKLTITCEEANITASGDINFTAGGTMNLKAPAINLN